MVREPEKKLDGYECPFLKTCDLVQRQAGRMPELIQRIRQRYCTNEKTRCARRWLYETQGAEVVPPLMLPDQMDWATQIFAECEAGAKR